MQHSSLEFEQIITQAMLDRERPAGPNVSTKSQPNNQSAPRSESSPLLVRVADVEPRQVRWLWPGRIALGRITLLVGRPGEGKSFVTMDAASRISTGTRWPDGGECPTGSVILISTEDNPSDTVRPRLDAHHADLSRIHLLSMVRRTRPDGSPFDDMFSLDDLPALETALQRIGDCKAIFIDPIGSFIGGNIDSHRGNEVRSILAPLAKLGESYGLAVLVVAHRRKNMGGSADDLALGSRAFTGIARSIWHLSRDPHDKKRRLLLPGKNNLSQELEGMAFTIDGTPATVVWERDPIALTADDALEQERGGQGGEPHCRQAAAEWLTHLLSNGEVESKLVEQYARDAGISQRTLRRAADKKGIIRERNAISTKWQWRLPKVVKGPAAEPSR